MNATERRQYHRQSFQHDVLLVVRGYNPVGCRMVNICDGGVLLSDLQSPEVLAHLASHPSCQVILHVTLGADRQAPREQVVARLKRQEGTTVGLQFEWPETALVARLLQTSPADRRHVLVNDQLRRRLWQSLNMMLHRQLGDLLEQFVETALAMLDQAAQETAYGDRIQPLKGAHKQLVRTRGAMVQDYLEAFGDRISRLEAASADESGSGRSALEIVEKAQFEDWLTLQMVATGVAGRYQNLLFRLNQLLSQLAGQTLTDRNNPLAPQALCELVQRCVHRVGFNDQSIPLLYGAFESVLQTLWPVMIDELNHQLIAGGLQALDLASMPPNWSQPDDDPVEPAASDKPTPEAHSPDQTTRNTSNPSTTSRGSVMRLVGLRHGVDTHGDGAEPGWSPAQLNTLRGDLRQALSDSAIGIEQALENCLADAPGNSLTLDVQTRDRARLADQLFAPLDSQARLSDSLREQLHQLRLPVLQTLLESPDFLDNQAHPARAIINNLMQLCLADRSASKSLESTVTEVVDRLVNASELDEALFDEIAQRLGVLVERQDQAFVRNADRIAKTLEGQQRLKQTRLAVQHRLNMRLAGQNVPTVLLDLLAAGWEQLMVLAVLKEGGQSATMAGLFEVVEQLQNLLGQDRVGEAPSFDQDLTSSALLEQVSRELMNLMDASQHRALIRRLQDQLQHRVEPDFRLLGQYPPDAPATPPAQADVDVADTRWLQRAQSLSAGDWISVRQDSGEDRRMRLVWGDESAYRFVFLTPHGLQEVEYELPDLVSRMQQGLIQQVDADRIPFVDQSLFGIVQDVYREMSYQAIHDPLTGCLHRHEFEKQLARLLLQARQQDQPGTLILLDIDQFSVVNAGYGTGAGDAVLKDLGQFLSGFEIQGDTASVLGRLGGNEFGFALLPMSVEDSLDFAERIRRAFENRVLSFEGTDIRNTLSLSVNVIEPQLSEMGELLNTANQTLKAGKRLGGNRVRFSREETGALPTSVSWVSRIDRALEDGSLSLRAQRIQPVAPDAEGGGYYEILLGLKDDRGEFISPQSFVEAAELYRRNTRLDRWVLDQTIDWIERHPDRVARVDGFNINLSGASLSDDAFLEYVASVVKRPSVPAHKLCLEVTETSAVASLHYTADFMREMKRLNCRFALDDFGTGMSSYAYLQHLPVDFVKIDGIFVRDIADNLTNYAMVRSINELSHFLGIETIAEFVEDLEALATLREINVDFAQGYGISRPRPLESLKPDPASR